MTPGTRRLLWAAALVAAVLALAVSFGWPGQRRHHRGMAALIEPLGLDDATRGAVEEVLEESHERRRASRPEWRNAHQQMRELMEADEPDEAAIFAAVDRLADLEKEARKERIRTLLRVREMLPPEARTRLVEKMKSHEGRRGHRDRHPRW